MIDTHCHLDSERFDADRESVLERAWKAGVEAVVVPGVWPKNWDALVEFARTHSNVHVAAGIHPQFLPELAEADDDKHLDALRLRLERGSVVAVGECGLDGPSVAAGAPMERQIRVLREHLRLAKTFKLPAMVHCFRAHPEMRELLEREGIPPAGLVIHSYSGSAELVKIFAPMGCHFGLAGPVTYAKARKPLDSARAIPADRLLLETDAPDQAPTPHRGQRSEPSFLPLIAKAIADARGSSLTELVAQTNANARTLFGLPSAPVAKGVGFR